MWIAYPLVKGLHELGHGLTIQRWGGEVHELGLMLLVFIPVPYVEASAATTFPSKSRRMLVGAAGVMVELLLASLALLVWLSVEPGWVRDLAFDITVIGGVSALLFNGNPLLRFDGYYVFSDLLEIPNLASRSQRYYAYLGKRYLLGIAGLGVAGSGPWRTRLVPVLRCRRLRLPGLYQPGHRALRGGKIFRDRHTARGLGAALPAAAAAIPPAEVSVHRRRAAGQAQPGADPRFGY